MYRERLYYYFYHYYKEETARCYRKRLGFTKRGFPVPIARSPAVLEVKFCCTRRNLENSPSSSPPFCAYEHSPSMSLHKLSSSREYIFQSSSKP